LDGALDISSFGGWRGFVARGKDMADQSDQRRNWPSGVPITAA
jgi:allophanate hydrolase